ncbi:MAG: PAS domain S-box protein [Desulfatibacillaceae bacterium]
MTTRTILILDDDPARAGETGEVLAGLGYEVASVPDRQDGAREALANGGIDVVLVNLGAGNGPEAAKEILGDRGAAVVLLGAGEDGMPDFGTIPHHGYAAWPCAPGELRAVIEAAARIADMERRLAETEAGYRDLYESAPMAHLSVDARSGTVIVCNAAAVRMFGYSRDELSGMPVLDLFLNGDDAMSRAREIDHAWRLGKGVRNVELPMRHAEGRLVWVSLSVRPVRDRAAEVVEGRMTAVDVTGSRTARDRLDRINEALLGLGTVFSANIRQLSALAGELLDADFACHVRMENRGLRTMGSWPARRPDSGVESACRDFAGDLVRDEASGIRVKQESADGEESGPGASGRALRTWAGAPVRNGGRTVGALCVGWRRAREPGGDDLRALGIIAAAVGQQERWKRAEDALKESEAHSRALVENTDLGIALMDTEYTIQAANKALGRLFGKSVNHMIGQKCHVEFSGSQVPCSDCPGAGAMETGGTCDGDSELVRADGSRFPTVNRAFPVRGADGQIRGFTQFIEDVSSRRLVEQKLRAQEELFSKIFYLSPLPIAISRMDTGRIVMVNETFASFAGGSTGDYIGELADDVWSDRAARKKTVRALRENGPFQGMELCFSTRDGEVRHCLLSAETVEIGGEMHVLAMAVDITDRVEAEDSLRRAHQQLRAIFDTFPGAVNVVDTDYNVLDLSESLRDMYDIPDRGEAIGKKCYAVYRKRQTPCPDCNLPRVMETGKLATRMVEPDEDHIGGGAYKSYMHPVKDDQGRIWGAVECLMDVADLRGAEERARAALAEKEVLIREVHHRVKNNFLVVIGLLDLQAAYIDHEPTLAMYRDIQERVRAMALVHQRLYQSRSLASIDFEAYLHEMTGNLFHMHGADPGQVELRILASGVHLSVDTAIPCGMIVNELVTNALKYAFKPRRKGEVQVGVMSTGPVYTLWVADNGMGLPPEFDIARTNSFGLRLVNILTRQLGGSLRLDTSRGTRVTVTFVEKERERSPHRYGERNDTGS